jgi:GH35 family endo-1,4-beta-xylanase
MNQQPLNLNPRTKLAAALCAPPAQLRFSGSRTSIRCLTAILLVTGACARGDTPSLKDAFKAHFYIGTAINRSIATGTMGFRRSLEQVSKDIAQVKEQFNQIVPENEMKWERIHPREGADGYDFAAADAFVEFGLSNNMYLVGHTLVRHAQTPHWVFAGTNPPPPGYSAAHRLRATGLSTEQEEVSGVLPRQRHD